MDLNATQAAIRAGYSRKTAASQGERLLRNVEVAAAVASGHRAALAKADLTATRVLEELRRIAFGDIGDLFDEHGHLRPVHELTPAARATIASVEVVKRYQPGKPDAEEYVHKVRLWDKGAQLVNALKHFGLLIERTEVTAKLSLESLVADSMKRER